MTDAAPATILLVEDDPATATFLADNLAAAGHHPVVPGGTPAALRLLERHAPDLALPAPTLPDGNGLDVLRAVRAADGIVSRIDPATPVVVLSGRDCSS